MTIIKELTTDDLLYNERENNKKLRQEIKNYKQALEKIREIILKSDPECACNISNIIIKKINEVLDDNEDENSEYI